MPARTWHAGNEGAVSAEAGVRRMDRHHVPDRAALRHRPGHAALEGRAASRWFVQDQRRQDLHLGWRARHVGQHHSPGAGAPAGRTGRHQGHFALPGTEIPAECRWHGRRAQSGVLRCDRRKDGHSRQLHLPDQSGRRDRLVDRSAEQGLECDVRDDECGTPGRRHAVARSDRSGVSKCADLRQGPHPDAQPLRRQSPRQASRSDHRPSRRATHAVDGQGVCRRRPCLQFVRGAADRPRIEPSR